MKAMSWCTWFSWTVHIFLTAYIACFHCNLTAMEFCFSHILEWIYQSYMENFKTRPCYYWAFLYDFHKFIAVSYRYSAERVCKLHLSPLLSVFLCLASFIFQGASDFHLLTWICFFFNVVSFTFLEEGIQILPLWPAMYCSNCCYLFVCWIDSGILKKKAYFFVFLLQSIDWFLCIVMHTAIYWSDIDYLQGLMF